MEVDLELSGKIIKEVKDIKDNIDLITRAYGYEIPYIKTNGYFHDIPYKEGFLRICRFMESPSWVVIYVNPDNFTEYRGKDLLGYSLDPEREAVLFSARYGSNPVLKKGPWVTEIYKLSKSAEVFINAREERFPLSDISTKLVYKETDI